MASNERQAQLEEVRRRTDIVELIGSRISLKRSGSSFIACCPFHQEKTPSFHVNPSGQFYKCFGCGEGGDVFSFLMKHDGLTFVDALRLLAERAGVELTEQYDDGQSQLRKRLMQLHGALSLFYRQSLLKLPEAQVARDYLRKRNLPAKIVEDFGIGFAPSDFAALENWALANRFTRAELVQGGVMAQSSRGGSDDFYDRFRGRLMFPISDTRGNVVAFSGRILQASARAAKYVNSAESPIFSKSAILYGLDKAQRAITAAPGRRAIVCEGQIDVIRCHASGFATAVASQGTAFTMEHVRLLKRYADSAVLVFDSDAAGRKAAISTARIFLESGLAVRIAGLPDKSDPDDFIVRQGAEAFGRLLDEAEEIIAFQTRWLQEQERDPDSADAVGRIADQLLETIHGSANAVHQARMLQEAADLLRLPIAALQTQFDKLAAAEAERAARRNLDSQRRQQYQQRENFDNRALDEARAFLAPQEELEEGFDLDVEGADRRRGLPPVRIEELHLCEFLVHHIDEEPLIRLVIEHLPLNLLEHPHARAVAGAVFETVISGEDALLRLQEDGDAPLLEFVLRLAVAPARDQLGDFTQREVAQDLILSIWRHWYQRRCTELAAAGNNGTADEQERLRLSLDLRALKQWQSGHAVIARERSNVTAAADATPERTEEAAAAAYGSDRGSWTGEDGGDSLPPSFDEDALWIEEDLMPE